MTTFAPRPTAGPLDERAIPRSARGAVAALRAEPTGPPPARFELAMLAHLPEPAQRWLGRAITPGTPLARSAELRMHGTIKVGGRWHDYTAAQVLTPDVGFVWAARTHLAGLRVSGFDSYVGEQGEMHWRMLGIPVQSASGDGVSHSAADRLAAESVLLPTSLVDAVWRHGHEPDSAVFIRQVAGRFARSHVTVSVADDGRLTGVRLRRWGNPDGTTFGEHVFDVMFDSEQNVDGLIVPDGIRAAWVEPSGTRDEFFRAEIDAISIGQGGQ